MNYLYIFIIAACAYMSAKGKRKISMNERMDILFDSVLHYRATYLRNSEDTASYNKAKYFANAFNVLYDSFTADYIVHDSVVLNGYTIIIVAPHIDNQILLPL